MKKLFSLAIAMGLVLCGQVFANDADLFRVNENQIQKDFSQLNQLENYVESHQGVSLNEVKNTNPDALGTLAQDTKNLQGLGSTLSSLGEAPLGIPSFVWGCVLGWIGILVVYLIAEDKEQTKKAFYGCLVGGVAYLVIYFVYVALIVGSAL